jgi:hypothetical protein
VNTLKGLFASPCFVTTETSSDKSTKSQLNVTHFTYFCLCAYSMAVLMSKSANALVPCSGFPSINCSERLRLLRYGGNIILRLVDKLLGNSREISNYTTAIIRQRPVNRNRRTVFSVWSVPICYKQNMLWELVNGWWVSEWVRGLLLFSCFELLLWEAGSWGTGIFREHRGRRTSAVRSRYQTTAVKTWLWTLAWVDESNKSGHQSKVRL